MKRKNKNYIDETYFWPKNFFCTQNYDFLLRMLMAPQKFQIFIFRTPKSLPLHFRFCECFRYQAPANTAEYFSVTPLTISHVRKLKFFVAIKFISEHHRLRVNGSLEWIPQAKSYTQILFLDIPLGIPLTKHGSTAN